MIARDSTVARLRWAGLTGAGLAAAGVITLVAALRAHMLVGAVLASGLTGFGLVVVAGYLRCEWALREVRGAHGETTGGIHQPSRGASRPADNRSDEG